MQQNRLALFFFALTLLTAGHAEAIQVGHPGAPTPAFSLRAAVGLGYSYRQLNGKNALDQTLLDSVKRFLIVGKFSLLPIDWLELGGTIMGADAKRSLTDYQGDLGIGGGGYVNFHPLLQEKFNINLTVGGGVNVIRNHGTAPNTDTTIPDTRVKANLKEREYFAHILVSRSMQTWNVYGGLVFDRAVVHQQKPPLGLNNLADVRGNSQFGMVIGVDYFITPLVYFGLEGHNFHEDAILGSIGMLIAPDGN